MKPSGPPRNHIPGRDYTTAVRGALLDDKTILKYILRGHYGEERRLAALAAQKKRKPRPRTPRSPTLSLALKLLKEKTNAD